MFSIRSLLKVGEWGMVTAGGGGGDAASQVKLSGRPESHSGCREGGDCVRVGRRRLLAAGCNPEAELPQQVWDEYTVLEWLRMEKTENAHVGNDTWLLNLPPINKFNTCTTNTDKVASVREEEQLICSR